jgi:hypothetical protein
MELAAVKDRIWIQLGDINFVYLLDLTVADNDSVCDEIKVEKSHKAAFPQAVRWAIQQVNQNSSRRFGFIIIDVCSDEKSASVTALSHLEREQEDGRMNFTAAIAYMPTRPAEIVANLMTYIAKPLMFVDMVTDGVAGKPSVVAETYTEDLKYMYMATFLSKFHWTSVSVVYETSSHGTDAMFHLRRHLQEVSVCVAVCLGVDTNATHKQLMDVSRSLVTKKNASVVLLFTPTSLARRVIEATSQKLPDYFIWIGDEKLLSNETALIDMGEAAMGIMAFRPYTQGYNDFKMWFSNLTLWDADDDPWFKQLYGLKTGCGKGREHCMGSICSGQPENCADLMHFELLRIIEATHHMVNVTTRVLDWRGVWIKKKKRRRGKEDDDKEADADEVSRGILCAEEKSVPSLHKFLVMQYQPGSGGFIPIANVFQRNNGTVSVTYEDVIMLWPPGRSVRGRPPLSRCSEACPPHHRKSHFKNIDITCCWQCKQCRANEYVPDDGMACLRCPERAQWPVAGAFNRCVDIEPERLEFLAATSIFQQLLALLMLAACLTGVNVYINYSTARGLSGGSKALYYEMLCGFALGYFSLITVHFRPSIISCIINFTLYSASFTVVYASILICTVRAFRIYTARNRLTIVRWRFQLLRIFSGPKGYAVLLCGQLAVIFYAVSITDDWVSKNEPRLDETSGRVIFEETCAPRTDVVFLNVAYIFIIIVFCLVFAFWTKDLPSAFNESEHTCECAATTFLLLAAFKPVTVGLAPSLFRAHVASLVLFINHTLCLGFLFLPKMNLIFLPKNIPILSETSSHADERLLINFVETESNTFVHSLVKPFEPKVPTCAKEKESRSGHQYTATSTWVGAMWKWLKTGTVAESNPYMGTVFVDLKRPDGCVGRVYSCKFTPLNSHGAPAHPNQCTGVDDEQGGGAADHENRKPKMSMADIVFKSLKDLDRVSINSKTSYDLENPNTSSTPETRSVRSKDSPETRSIRSKGSPETKSISSKGTPETRSIRSKSSPETRSIRSKSSPETRSIRGKSSPETRSIRSKNTPETRSVRSKNTPETRSVRSKNTPETRSSRGKNTPETRSIKSNASGQEDFDTQSLHSIHEDFDTHSMHGIEDDFDSAHTSMNEDSSSISMDESRGNDMQNFFSFIVLPKKLARKLKRLRRKNKSQQPANKSKMHQTAKKPKSRKTKKRKVTRK